jgi:hypothetical protein
MVKPKVISKADFEVVINCLLVKTDFNTSNAKDCFKGTKIYKKRSPLFAILRASGIIEEKKD